MLRRSTTMPKRARELKFFNPLKGSVCTTCASGNQEKSIEGKRTVALSSDGDIRSSLAFSKNWVARAQSSYATQKIIRLAPAALRHVAIPFQIASRSKDQQESGHTAPSQCREKQFLLAAPGGVEFRCRLCGVLRKPSSTLCSENCAQHGCRGYPSPPLAAEMPSLRRDQHCLPSMHAQRILEYAKS